MTDFGYINCHECGAVLHDWAQHNEWHSGQDDARKLRDRIRELHKPITLWTQKGGDGEGFESVEEALEYIGCDEADLETFAICEECRRLEHQPEIDYDFTPYCLGSLWPCRTIQLIEAAE